MISLRSPDLTAFASAVTRLGSASVVVWLGVAAAVILGLRSRRILLPLSVLGALAATAGLVTILKIALDRPRPPAELVVGVPLSSDAFPSGHTTDGSVLVVLAASMHALTFGNVLIRRLLMISACPIALLIGCSRTYLGLKLAQRRARWVAAGHDDGASHHGSGESGVDTVTGGDTVPDVLDPGVLTMQRSN